MALETVINDNETFVPGRSPEKAAELLALAAAAGLDGQVSTTFDGYIVPSAILASDVKDVDPAVLAELEAEKAAAGSEAPAEAPAADGFDPLTAPIEEVNTALGKADSTTPKGTDATAAEPATSKGDK